MIHNRSLAWTKLYGMKQVGLFSIMGGVQILNSDDAFPFMWKVGYYKKIGGGYLELSSSGTPTPKHPDLDDPSDGSAFEYWSRSTIQGGYNNSSLEIGGYLAMTQNGVIGSDNTPITFAGGEISYRFQNGWELFTSFYNQLDTTEFIGGIGTQIKAGIKGKLNLFKNNMKIDETPDQDYEVVKIANVGIDSHGNQGVLILKSSENKEFHMSAFSTEVAMHISSFINDSRHTIPTIYNMIEQICEESELLLVKIKIYETGNILRANLYFTGKKDLLLRHFRASDAIALATFYNIPILVRKNLLQSFQNTEKHAYQR